MNVSIVTYKTDIEELRTCLDCLKNDIVKTIFVIDNANEDRIRNFCGNYKKAIYIANKNTGYGAAHNIAIKKSITENADYHLVLNSDVSFSPSILNTLVDYMDKNADIAQIQPNIVSADGAPQYTCRLLPTPKDLFFRRFLPKSWIKKNDERYLLKFFDHKKIVNIPYHQGSFMLFRTKCFEEIGLFDERFFMYPEDIDITRRMHKKYKTIFFPTVSVTHNHRAASYKNFRMMMIHAINIARYFNKWGWLFDDERTRINKETIALLLDDK